MTSPPPSPTPSTALSLPPMPDVDVDALSPSSALTLSTLHDQPEQWDHADGEQVEERGEQVVQGQREAEDDWEEEVFEDGQDEDDLDRYATEQGEEADRWSALSAHSETLLRVNASARDHGDLSPPAWTRLSEEDRVGRVIRDVEKVVEEQMEALERWGRPINDGQGDEGDVMGDSPAFVYPNLTSWDNVVYCPHRGLLPRDEDGNADIIQTVTSLGRSSSARKYSLILLLLFEVWELCRSRSFATRRDLYYKHAADFASQSDVDAAVSVVSAMLGIPRIQLRVLTTSKGLVAGCLRYVTAQGMEANCSRAVNGETVPQDVEGVTHVRSSALFVLVVEKDATFQKMLDEDAVNVLPPCIIITGKGVPDLNTRQFVHLLWRELAIPVFALVDADPFGIEIMFTYRFGSLAMAWCCERTAVTSMRWIGVLPSELEGGQVEDRHLLPLSSADRAKLESLRSRPYVLGDAALAEEIECLAAADTKAEIQCRESPTRYVGERILAGRWI